MIPWTITAKPAVKGCAFIRRPFRPVPNLASLSRLSLGIMPIPLDRVIGSVSRGRSYAFAEGFLPILEGGSEFASKWENLCESVEQKGVNQPVTVLEYLGNYYAI